MKYIGSLNGRQLRILSLVVVVGITAALCAPVSMAVGAAVRGSVEVEVPVTVTPAPMSPVPPSSSPTVAPVPTVQSVNVVSLQMTCKPLSGNNGYGYFAVEQLGLGDPNTVPGPFWLKNADGSLDRFERMADMDGKVTGHTEICVSQ